MRFSTCSSFIVMLVALGSTPLLAAADNLDADARFAEGNPPVIPHRIQDDATAKECLGCHWPPGKATYTPHPLRTACTQCHVRSVVDAAPQEPAKPAHKKARR
ncbi:hypothetical protein GMSM_41240 [Geomonas sp. Red276]